MGLPRVSVDCTSPSTCTVLLSTISSAIVSCSMDVITVTSISTGPRVDKTGSESDGCNPSLELSSVLSALSGSSMASWYSCSTSSCLMFSCKNGSLSVIVPRWSLSVVAFGDGSSCMTVLSMVAISSGFGSPELSRSRDM